MTLWQPKSVSTDLPSYALMVLVCVTGEADQRIRRANTALQHWEPGWLDVGFCLGRSIVRRAVVRHSGTESAVTMGD